MLIMVEKIAMLTGGVGEIGTAIVKEFSTMGLVTIALDIESKEHGEKWLESCQAEGIKNVDYHVLDVTDYKACRELVHEVSKQYGQINILVNNAGITRDAVFYKMTQAQWQEVLSVNLDGMFNMTQPVVEVMRGQGSGRIVNVSSVNAQKGQFSQANYAASKSGIYGFTKSLAQELMSKNITVNSISPGYVDTHLMKSIRADILEKIIDNIPAKRLARPDEIAWAVRFLIDERSAYITGANLSINGGLHMY